MNSFSEFYRDCTHKDFFKSVCKSCDDKRKTKWKNDNRERHLETKRIYQSKRYTNDINFKLANILRNRLRKALLKQVTYKIDTTEALIEISYQEFRNYVEFLKSNDMERNNIDLDHVQSLSSFDLTDIEQLRKAAHYTNIQPLLTKDNRSKSDRVHQHGIWS